MEQATSRSFLHRRAGFLRVGQMNCCARLTAPATLVRLSRGVIASEFSYGHLEITAEPPKTSGTAKMAPLEEDANGHFFGIAGSRKVPGLFHVTGTWSRENKGLGTVDGAGSEREGLVRPQP